MAKAPQTKETEQRAHARVDKAAEKAHAAVDKAADAAGRSSDKLHDVADGLKEQAQHFAEQAGQRSRDVSNAVCTYTRENPLKTIGLAFLAGAVVTSLCRRK
ncbi:hypothetical protein [Idiomarina xiamenensis]|uniref:DUF883 domain-containing protein n=1 Tax=Idiomarina xiamenensis 10-D-4 TaxID=740709 RepID=K2KR12_9GAMM|nr:hypothetical protein [Idiomarina xiamenensis]EKE79940.1 hypothetical protein A10D4_12188 [Idiomarina xiamenensis 10-D-4]